MTLAITPDPQSARATFRERTCAIARAPDDAALHLARLHAALGNCPAALPLARNVHERMAWQFDGNMQATLIAAGQLGEIERNCGDRETGLARIREAEYGLRTHFGEDNIAAQGFRRSLAQSLVEEERLHAGE